MTRLRRELERHGRWLIAFAVLGVFAAASAVYILSQQNVVTPLADRYTLRAEFESTSGLEPGLDQPVQVAGVRVGSITGVRVRDGRSLVTMRIAPGHLPHVYPGARATLVPNSPLKDLQVEIVPGDRRRDPLPSGTTLAVAQTTPPADLDELLRVLDSDTRDYLRLLIAGTGEGTRARGRDLGRALRTLRPTSAHLEAVTGALAGRRRELRRLVHNLQPLTGTAATADRELARVVEQANATVGALAGQERALRASLRRLPGTLGAARRVARRTTFTRRLRPTLDALVPVAERLPEALPATGRLAGEATPLLRDEVRPLVRELQRPARELRPIVRDLDAVTPALTDAFQVLRYVANELGHNPAGDEEGYLFWLAWGAHNLMSTVSTEDAHGSVFRGFDILDCAVFTQQPPFQQELAQYAAPLPTC